MKQLSHNFSVLILISLTLVLCSFKANEADTLFSKKMVPEPILEQDKSFVDLYYKAWELAFAHIKNGNGLPQSPYMDEAFDENTIWIWDTSFMVQFCKYAPDIFPGILSLTNFYAPIHDKVELPLRIEIPDNPPLFAWTEFEYNKLTNDKSHIITLLYKSQYLQKHFEWFNNSTPGTVIANSAPTCLQKTDIGFRWEGGRSGMDNSPRGRTGEHALKARPNNPKMLWIDAIAQQGLSALCISKLFTVIGDKKSAQLWKEKYNAIKLTVNKYYWDNKDGFYYDINETTLQPIKVKTPASYWPMLAEMCSTEQAEKLVAQVKDSNVLGGIVPWVSLARNDPDFNKNGGYWRGSMWLPTAYMGIKALQKYNYLDEAAQNAYSIVSHMDKTYQQYSPHTIWECYNPTKPIPAINEYGTRCRADFCGWSALGAISLLIENVLGFYDINSATKTIKWHKVRKDTHGIRNLKFGNIVTSIVSTNNKITVSSTDSYNLIVNGKKVKVKKGNDLSYSL